MLSGGYRALNEGDEEEEMPTQVIRLYSDL